MLHNLNMHIRFRVIVFCFRLKKIFSLVFSCHGLKTLRIGSPVSLLCELLSACMFLSSMHFRWIVICTIAEVSCLFILFSYSYERALYQMQGTPVKYRVFFFLSRDCVPQNGRHSCCVATKLWRRLCSAHYCTIPRYNSSVNWKILTCKNASWKCLCICNTSKRPISSQHIRSFAELWKILKLREFSVSPQTLQH